MEAPCLRPWISSHHPSSFLPLVTEETLAWSTWSMSSSGARSTKSGTLKIIISFSCCTFCTSSSLSASVCATRRPHQSVVVVRAAADRLQREERHTRSPVRQDCFHQLRLGLLHDARPLPTLSGGLLSPLGFVLSWSLTPWSAVVRDRRHCHRDAELSVIAPAVARQLQWRVLHDRDSWHPQETKARASQPTDVVNFWRGRICVGLGGGGGSDS